MLSLISFLEDEQSTEIARDAVLLGCLAIVGILIVATFGVALPALWSAGNADAVLSNTLG